MTSIRWQRIAAPALWLTMVAAPASLLAADKCGGVTVSSALSGLCKDSNANPIFALASAGILLFSMVFGVLLVLVIVISGLQYAISAGSPERTREAKQRLEAAVTGLILFVLMFAILQILLPDNVKLFR